jgi:hypothetical protein
MAHTGTIYDNTGGPVAWGTTCVGGLINSLQVDLIFNSVYVVCLKDKRQEGSILID